MVQQLLRAIANPDVRLTALRVALVVGSMLFAINHGQALITGQMNRTRWVSGLLTYCVPYLVSLHGQSQGSDQRKPR